jgi:PEGA domain-containing protein
VIGLVLVAAGATAYLILGRSGSGEQGAVPAVDTVRIQDTVRVPAQASREPRRRAASAVAAQSFLTIASDPFGQVYVDGVDAGQTPVVEYAVQPGRHTIRIERAGFKTMTERVQVDASNTVRKRYTLLPE